MAADVRQRPDCPVAAVHDDEGFVRQAVGHEPARLGDLLDAADAVPFLLEEMFHLEGRKVRVGVERRRHGPGLVVVARQRAPERRAHRRQSVRHGGVSPKAAGAWSPRLRPVKTIGTRILAVHGLDADRRARLSILLEDERSLPRAGQQPSTPDIARVGIARQFRGRVPL